MRGKKSDISRYVMIAVVGLCLLLLAGAALCADITGKTYTTKPLPGQTSTQTAPLPTNTQTTPLPTRTPTTEYQRIEKPPVRTLDLPDCDVAGEIRNVNFCRDRSEDGRETHRLTFQLALMNRGKKQIIADIPVKIRGVNNLNNTLFKVQDHVFQNMKLENNYWTVNWIDFVFILGVNGAPVDIKNVKLIVEIDPNNTLHEEQRFRGNNRCVYTR